MITETEDKKEQVNSERIKSILFLLESFLDDYKNEIQNSSALLDVDIKTELSKKIENTLNNPLHGIYNVSLEIDNQIKQLVELLVIAHFKKHQKIIKEAYKTKTAFNDLHYCIVLINDNEDTRNELFSFYDKYELLEADFAHKYPVHFQFVPYELIGKMFVSHKIELNTEKV